MHYREEVHRIGREPDGWLRVESGPDAYRAPVVVIAIGILGRPNKPSYPVPREVSRLVRFDVTGEPLRGLDILVIGGGDTATEYCQFLVQEGNRVTLSYRGPDLTRPNPINRDSVLALERRGRLSIRLDSEVAALAAAEGRVRVLFSRPLGAGMEVDRVIYALGGTTPENFLKSVGIEFEGGSPRLTKSFATSVPGLYLAGDLTAGKRGGSIILAFNTAAVAMRKICEDHGICRVGGLASPAVL